MSRPQTQIMPRTELLEALGDAVIDGSTLKELDVLRSRAGEPDQKDVTLEDILKDPEKYARSETAFTFDDAKPVTEKPIREEHLEDSSPEPTEPEVSKPEPEAKDSVEEALKIHKAQIEAQMDAHKQAMERLAQQRLQAPSEPAKAPEQEPEFMQYSANQIEQLRQYDPFQAQVISMQQNQYRLEQQLKTLEAREIQREERITAKRFDDAIEKIKGQYSDFEKYVSADTLNQARELSIKSRKSDADFAGWASSVYKQLSFDDKINAQQKEQDEVSQKRDQKRQQLIKSSTAASGGGGVFQAPQTTSKDPSMRGGRNEMLAEFRALGYN